MEVEANSREQVMAWAETQGDFLNSSVQKLVGPDPFAKVIEKLCILRQHVHQRYSGCDSDEVKSLVTRDFTSSRYAFFA